LLLADETLAARVYNKRVAPVFFRWAAQPDGPLADGFALAARFLAATDEANRDELFRQLCESPLRNMRRFACSASFTYVGWWKGASQVIPFGRGYDPLVQSHLALLYLKHAAPRLNREERIDVTVEFAWWLQMVDLEELPDELKEAFEAWHLKELSVRDDMRQPKAVLEALQRMQKARGAATTLGLFKKSGRADLLGRVQECARSGDPEVEKLARELLTRLDAPEAKGP